MASPAAVKVPFRPATSDIGFRSADISRQIRIVAATSTDKYVEHFAELLKNSTSVHGADAILKENNIYGDIRVLYRDQSNSEHIATQFGIFKELEDGVPRTAYKGIVVFRYQTQKRVFLVGPDSLQQLGIKED